MQRWGSLLASATYPCAWWFDCCAVWTVAFRELFKLTSMSAGNCLIGTFYSAVLRWSYLLPVVPAVHYIRVIPLIILLSLMGTVPAVHVLIGLRFCICDTLSLKRRISVMAVAPVLAVHSVFVSTLSAECAFIMPCICDTLFGDNQCLDREAADQCGSNVRPPDA